MNFGAQKSHHWRHKAKQARPGSRRRTMRVESLEERHLLAVSAGLYITELMAANTDTLADTDGDYPDWIEILNHSDAPVDLAGWSLTDDVNLFDRWTFPSVTLAPDEQIVIFASGKDRTIAGEELHADFKLDDAGDYLALVRPDGSSIAQEFPFPAQSDDVSFGLPMSDFTPTDGAAAGLTRNGFITDTSPRFFDRFTPGSTNRSGERGPRVDGQADSIVTFNEIMYHDADGNPALDWLELYNQNATDIDLSEWSIEGGLFYQFPSGTVIPGGGYLVVAKDPAALETASGFDSSIGPFAGNLRNGGQQIALRNNSGRIMDSIRFADDEPWPVGPDGSGATLAKLKARSASGVVENWTHSPEIGGTPGDVNFVETPAAEPVPSQITITDFAYFPGPGGVSRIRPVEQGLGLANAFDGDLGTVAAITSDATTGLDHGRQRVAAGFSPQSINRLRINKAGDLDGLPADGVDPADLVVFVTTDTNLDLSARDWVPVSRLTNGYNGVEIMDSAGVNGDGNVLQDVHNSTADQAGFFSLTFGAVFGATGIAIEFLPSVIDGNDINQYRIRELEAYFNTDVELDFETSIEIPIVAIDVFDAADQTIDRNRVGDLLPAESIDDDLSTWGSPASVGTNAPIIVALDLETVQVVNRLRVAKVDAQIDPAGQNPDLMDLEILYTSDSGPLKERTYQRVRRLNNGFLGAELINAGSVNDDGTINDDVHDPTAGDSRFWQVSFDAVQATALAIRVARDGGDENTATQYGVYEYQAFQSDLLFDPQNSVSSGTLAFWIDADDLTTITDVGGFVSQWDDKSDSGNDAVQSVSFRQPQLIADGINGRPVVRFAGDGSTNDILTTIGVSPFSGNQFGITVFTVLKQNLSPLTFSSIVSQNPGGRPSGTGMSFMVAGTVGGAAATDHWSPGGRRAADAVPVGGNGELITWVVPQWAAHQTSTDIFYNGQQQPTSTYSLDTYALNLGAGPLRIGNWDENRNDMAFRGDVAEVLVYDGALSAADRQRVEQYLGEKWSIPIAACRGCRGGGDT